ncbi:indolepyruvate oxidoreductase subunit beta [Petrimonas mucosa]|jgi:indolepyruvate ferredoxin oxidoreductase beta subunit|uniref:Indolepyruvate oxidoreductase subunit IorB n=2 Tax=Petrimonas TaxID=307628 RepID=A0A1G4GAG6_9BACT|nr:indolepyruvate oxidoreductase subunit beta [Petrimonas mucosa]MDD3560362.1 indolepyruvate oxidoreductase subunit beta [Petrimonas mucosa]SCM59481.1 Indolepyruvate oxidoreductase subunit IorB [Petrimonas mucosa]SFU34884.1 indolepyruvate ferredoxin oxidoreductase beta subunit [Porphyromonadaceae bacterium KHP3R9]HHT30566.1 indolepyruvate oxidoreductase subunit beta [Petrimonas mucosa]
MNKNIIISGVGGQGILTVAAIIDLAALNLGLKVKQAEVHGMSQRGGAVESHLRISTGEIFSDLIPRGKADLILSLEPMESLRYLPYLSPEGIIVTATEPYLNIENYPAQEVLLETIAATANHLLVNAASVAKEAGSIKSYNVVMLGAAAPYLEIAPEELERAIEIFFSRKGKEMVELNINAFRLGRANALNEQK